MASTARPRGRQSVGPLHVPRSSTEETLNKQRNRLRVKSQTCVQVSHFLASSSGWKLHAASASLRLVAAITASLHTILILLARPFADATPMRRGRDLRLLLQSIHIMATFLFALSNVGFGGMSLNFLAAVRSGKTPNAATRWYTYETQSVRLCLILAVGYTAWLAVFTLVAAESACRPLAAVFEGDSCARAKLIALGFLPGLIGIVAASLIAFLNTGRYFVVFNSLAYVRMVLGWTTIGASIAAQMLCHNVLAFKHLAGFSDSARQQIKLFGDLCFLYGGSVGLLALVEGCVSTVAGWLRSKLQIVIEAVRDVVTFVALLAFGAGLIWANDVQKYLSRWEKGDRGIQAYNTLSFKALVVIMISSTVVLIACTLFAGGLSVAGLCVSRWGPREWSIKKRLLHRPRRLSSLTLDGGNRADPQHR